MQEQAEPGRLSPRGKPQLVRSSRCAWELLPPPPSDNAPSPRQQQRQRARLGNGLNDEVQAVVGGGWKRLKIVVRYISTISAGRNLSQSPQSQQIAGGRSDRITVFRQETRIPKPNGSTSVNRHAQGRDLHSGRNGKCEYIISPAPSGAVRRQMRRADDAVCAFLRR